MQLIPVHPSQVPSNIKDILDNYISGHPMSATDARKLLDHAHQIQFTSLLPYQEPGMAEAATHAFMDGAVLPVCLMSFVVLIACGIHCLLGRVQSLWGLLP